MLRRIAFALMLASLPTGVSRADTIPAEAERTIRAVKAEERAVGIQPTGNFADSDPSLTAYYRCYYTGKLELPGSYDDLKLQNGTKDGCRLDEKKYDVFFYPIEAVSTGHEPVTAALAAAPVERLATVVSHEDFHVQVRDLPDRLAEAATTLVGFLAGAAAVERNGPTPSGLEAELFLRKAVIINRYYEQLGTVYQSVRRGGLSKRGALEEKERLLGALQWECASIQPAPRTFNPCVSAANNAGLAFDYTYTRDYPLLYEVYRTCHEDLRWTIETIGKAPRKQPEAEVVRYLRGIAHFCAGK